MSDTIFKESKVKLFGIYWRCVHCGNFCGKTQKQYCEHCRLAKDRQDGCEENKRIFKSNGLEEPYCKICKI